MNLDQNNFIQEFEILGLFGNKDICIPFKNSTLIVIGENGIGKTTILNALNNLLTFSYRKLLEIKFESIRIRINNEDFRIDRLIVLKYVDYLRRKKENDESEFSVILCIN